MSQLGLVRITLEHGSLAFRGGGACVEEVILLAGLVYLARNQACVAVWVKSITLAAHDPSATDNSVIVGFVHIDLCVNFPNHVIKVVELFNHR